MFKWRTAIPEVPQPPTPDQIKDDLANALTDDIIFKFSKDSSIRDSNTQLYNEVKQLVKTSTNIKSEMDELKTEQDVLLRNSDCVKTLITQLKDEKK